MPFGGSFSFFCEVLAICCESVATAVVTAAPFPEVLRFFATRVSSSGSESDSSSESELGSELLELSLSVLVFALFRGGFSVAFPSSSSLESELLEELELLEGISASGTSEAELFEGLSESESELSESELSDLEPLFLSLLDFFLGIWVTCLATSRACSPASTSIISKKVTRMDGATNLTTTSHSYRVHLFGAIS